MAMVERLSDHTMEHASQTPSTADDPTGRKWTWEEDGFTVVRGNARTAPGCHDNCGLLMYVDKDGKLDHVEGDPEDPYNQGRLCLRCLCVTDQIYHKDRQTYPMKRVREDRGLDRWERISWDEAYDILYTEVRKVQEKYGANSLAIHSGTGRDVLLYGSLLGMFMGTKNNSMGFFPGQSCYIPRTFSTNLKSGAMFTGDYSQYFPDRYDHPTWARPDYVLIWGNNPVVANSDGTLGHWIVECMKRGSKLITVDPKLTWCAAHSEIWLQVRPGTDTALALAMGNVIVNEDLYDHEFVDEWTYGFDAYRESVQEWTPARAAEICEIEEELIIEAARAIGNAQGWALQWGVALDHTTTGFYAGMACYDLVGITGMFDHPGGMVAGMAPFGCGIGWVPSQGEVSWVPMDPSLGPAISKESYAALNVLGMTDAESEVESLEGQRPDYPIKACGFIATNSFSNEAAEPARVMNAVKNNSEFNFVMDMWMTPLVMSIADLFLPIATFAERPGITGHNPYRLGAIVQAIEPEGEARSDQQIIYEIGRKFRGADLCPWEKPEDFYDFLLGDVTHSGFTYEDMKERGWAYPEIEYYRYKSGKLRADGAPGFNTATTKYEFTSVAMEAMGMETLGTYKEPLNSPVSTPELAERYPLVLTTGARRWGFFHSEGRQIPHLRRVHPEPEFYINPKDAEKYGIEHGDWCLIENEFGSCRQKADVTVRMKEGVISADHGWWFPERERDDGTYFGTLECNINSLLPLTPGKVGLGNAYKSGLCRVSKIEN